MSVIKKIIKINDETLLVSVNFESKLLISSNAMNEIYHVHQGLISSELQTVVVKKFSGKECRNTFTEFESRPGVFNSQ